MRPAETKLSITRSRSIRLIALIASIALFSVGAPFLTSLAASAANTTPQVTLSAYTVAPGGKVQVRVINFDPGSSDQIAMYLDNTIALLKSHFIPINGTGAEW